MTMRMESITSTDTIRIDRSALASIYDQYSPGLYRYACRLLGDPDQAEECVAETFSRFLHAVRDGRNPDNIQAYLYRMAHNWITDQYRRQQPIEPLDPELASNPAENPAQIVAGQIEAEHVRAALRRLPAEQRLVVALRFLEQRSHEEVAEVLGKTIEATRALQHRALAALRLMLVEKEA
jgi:RNA polymerase sigma-70 factor, ECF subfamily